MPSMGTVGDAYDNALVESFWATLQTELLDRQKWTTRSQLRAAVFDYIEVFYNRKRLHSSLGYKSPVEFETEWAATQAKDMQASPNNQVSTKPGQLHLAVECDKPRNRV